MRLYWDIEANDLLEGVSKVWCICATDLDKDQDYQWGPNEIEEALAFLADADYLVGHNTLRYDHPALKKVHGWDPKKPLRRDTLVLARLKHPNLKVTDTALVQKGTLPNRLHGRDSLEAWGYRVGIHKAGYEGGFEAWSQEMQDYCMQDVRTGKALWLHLNPDAMDPRSVELEHRAAEVTFEMEMAGWDFDEKAAGELYTTLVARRHELETALVEKFGSWQEVARVLIPKRDNKTRGYKAGVPVTIYKTVTFNPNSRKHIEKKLREYGWEPDEFTPSGQAKLDEEVLENIELPEAQTLIEFLMVQKRIGQLGDGKQSWLQQVKQGKIHCSYKTMGTVTGRAAHVPNISQVPKVRKNKAGETLYGAEGKWSGAECRALFKPRKGHKALGADFEGLELRCLSHYMTPFDKGAYGQVVCDGDIHTVNQKAAGLPTRDNAKTFIYGWLYGAGDAKIGSIVGKGRSAGAVLKAKFLRGLPALGKLRQVVAQAAAKGWLRGLDGRHIPVRAKHAALNSLLQSAGAVLCKVWLVNTYDALLAAGYRWEDDFVILGWIHDELQLSVREGLEDEIGTIVVKCAQEAGEAFGFKCRLDSKYIVGNSWKETH